MYARKGQQHSMALFSCGQAYSHTLEKPIKALFLDRFSIRIYWYALQNDSLFIIVNISSVMSLIDR